MVTIKMKRLACMNDRLSTLPHMGSKKGAFSTFFPNCCSVKSSVAKNFRNKYFRINILMDNNDKMRNDLCLITNILIIYICSRPGQ